MVSRFSWIMKLRRTWYRRGSWKNPVLGKFFGHPIPPIFSLGKIPSTATIRLVIVALEVDVGATYEPPPLSTATTIFFRPS